MNLECLVCLKCDLAPGVADCVCTFMSDINLLKVIRKCCNRPIDQQCDKVRKVEDYYYLR